MTYSSLKLLRNDCSTGYDNILVSFIKTIAEHIASPLTFIINNLIEESKLPYQWKIAFISPIPKVTNPTELKNYRPISILPILSKVYEKQVLHQIIDFIGTQVKHKYITNTNLVIAKTTQLQLSSQNYMTTLNWLRNKVSL